MYIKRLPKFFLFCIALVILFGSAVAFKFGPDLIEKYSLKPPPPFKKLSEADSQPSTQSGKIKYPHDYTFVILGDSMTETLGNTDELRGYLNEYYPDKTFEVLNYGYGATSIISAKERMVSTTYHSGRDFAPIKDIDFDYLLVESFGHNPLSEFNEGGLKKQTEILEDLVEFVATTSGKEKLVFVGTIGTNKETYAKNTQDLSAEVREQWALERDAYIKNHMDFARSQGIPVIDIFTPSLDSSGNAKQYLIRNDDYIHPSPSGVLYISKKIADFMAANLIK